MILIFDGGLPHFARFFYQCVHVLYHELLDLGYDVRTTNTLTEGTKDDIYILFCSHAYFDTMSTIPTQKIIIYHSEQIYSFDEDHYISKYKSVANKGYIVWSYNETDIPILKSIMGPHVYHMPFGFSNYFSVISDQEGSLTTKYSQNSMTCINLMSNWGMTTRRDHFLKSVTQPLQFVNECWTFNDYKKLVTSYFLFTNINKHHNYYSCPARILPLICNKCLVIAEKTTDNNRLMLNITTPFNNPDEMNQLIKYYLDNPNIAKEVCEIRYNWLKTNYHMKDILKSTGCLNSLNYFCT